MKAANHIADILVRRGETLAVAESVTAGLLQNRFSQTNNATQYFEGGITAYNVGKKTTLLGVDYQHARMCNCVSERVAQEMALGVMQLFESDFGISVTGYAVPVPEISIHSIFAIFAIAHKGKIVKVQKVFSNEIIMRSAQEDYCKYIMTAILDYLSKLR